MAWVASGPPGTPLRLNEARRRENGAERGGERSRGRATLYRRSPSRVPSATPQCFVPVTARQGPRRALPGMAWCDGGSLREILSSAENLRLSPELWPGSSLVAAGLHARELTELGAALCCFPAARAPRRISAPNILGHQHRSRMVAAGFPASCRARGQIASPHGDGAKLGGQTSIGAGAKARYHFAQEFDRRADVSRTGVVLYEAFPAGARAFHACTDALATMYQISSAGWSRPASLFPTTRRSSERIVLKALAKSVNDRYQTAKKRFQLDLEEWLAQSRKVVSERLAIAGNARRNALRPRSPKREEEEEWRNKGFERRSRPLAKKPNAEEEETVLDEGAAHLLRPGAERHCSDAIRSPP